MEPEKKVTVRGLRNKAIHTKIQEVPTPEVTVSDLGTARIYTQQDVDYAVSLAVAVERNRAQRLSDLILNEAFATRTDKQGITLKDANDVALFHRMDGMALAYEWSARKVLELTGPEQSDAEIAEQDK